MESSNYSWQESGDLLFNTTSYDVTVQTGNSCTRYHEQFSDISTTLALTTAAVSLAACVVVTGLICLLKKHHFLSQRLILYLVVAVILRCLSWVPQRVHVELVESGRADEDVVRGLCSSAGYISLTTGWFEVMAVASITTYQILQTVKTNSHRWHELTYVLATFLTPLTFTWIPFIDGAYGPTGQWCWVRLDTNDCRKYTFGIVLGYMIWFVPLVLILLLLLVFYSTVTYRITKRNTRWDGNLNPMSRNMRLRRNKEARPLIWCPLIYFLLYLVPLSSQIADTVSSEPVHLLWTLSAITQGLQGGFIALAFTLDVRTLRRLRRQNITGTVRGIRETIIVENYRSEPEPEEHPYDLSSSFLAHNGDDGHSRVITARYTEYN